MSEGDLQDPCPEPMDLVAAEVDEDEADEQLWKNAAVAKS